MISAVGNSELEEELCELVVAALPVVRGASEQERTAEAQQVRWVADPEMHGFVQRPVASTVPGHLDSSTIERLAALPQYDRAREALVSDRGVAKLLDKWVGGPFVASPFHPADILNKFILSACEKLHGTDFSSETVLRVWKPFEAAIHEETIEYVVVAPLLGVAVEERLMELDLQVSISVLSDEQLVRCLEAGIFREVGLKLPPLNYRVVNRDELPSAGIRITIPFKRGIFETETSPDGTPRPVGFPAERESVFSFSLSVDQVLTALRLHKPGYVSVPGLVWWSENYFAGNGAGWETREYEPWHSRYQPPTYTLPKNAAGELARVYKALLASPVQQRSALQLALRRLNLAVDRSRDDDRLVDMLICAEALLVQESNAGARTELRFRVSLRAGRVFGSDVFSPREVYAIMQCAYDARSAIVHGAIPKRLRLPDQGQVTLDEFVGAVERVIRKGAKAMVLRASVMEPGAPLVPPDETLLSE